MKENEIEESILAIISKLSQDFPERTYIGKDYSVRMLRNELYTIIEKFCKRSDKFVEVV